MTPTSEVVVLASASQRRAALLRRIGIAFRTQPTNVREARLTNETAEQCARRLAAAKAGAVTSELPVLAADTVIVAPDGTVFGKPRHRADFMAMFQALAANTHQAVTAIALRHDGRTRLRVARAAVAFRAIAPAEARAYWATGEPRDKAGGYALQGIGSIFARCVHGSPSAVEGLPLMETEELLRTAGVDTWRGRATAG